MADLRKRRQPTGRQLEPRGEPARAEGDALAGSSSSSISKLTARMSSAEQEEYSTMVEIERLESLLEDLEDLGVQTRDELKSRIGDLRSKLD